MQLEHEHTSEAIIDRLQQERRPNYLRDWVYGGIDGAVTTFAVIAGVAGAALSPGIVLILGISNIVADGFSMAAANYSGTKSEIDDMRRLAEVERRHIALVPEGEREEIRQILVSKGLSGAALEEAVTAITSNEQVWVETMLAEEYGLPAIARQPVTAGLYTFSAFMACGGIPLIPYLIGLPDAFQWAILATGVVFFVIGSVKSRWSLARWWHSGLETLAIGMSAAGLAYVIGYLLRHFVGVEL
ncbi:MAG: VIT1/CCC1 transporter family protein [Hyphomicrobiaceae bacterium]|nr:VIT1/CCC1 transporter family protein [Hyphomicrobiaceae bacterium]